MKIKPWDQWTWTDRYEFFLCVFFSTVCIIATIRVLLNK